MEHSSIVDMAGWRSLAIQAGLAIIGVFGFVMLFSFGGQLIVAPALLPVQWFIARNTDGWVSHAFALLGAALLFEVLFLGLLLAVGESSVVGFVGAGVAVVGAVMFYLASRTGR